MGYLQYSVFVGGGGFALATIIWAIRSLFLANAFGTALSSLRDRAPLRVSRPSGLQSHFAGEI